MSLLSQSPRSPRLSVRSGSDVASSNSPRLDADSTNNISTVASADSTAPLIVVIHGVGGATSGGSHVVHIHLHPGSPTSTSLPSPAISSPTAVSQSQSGEATRAASMTVAHELSSPASFRRDSSVQVNSSPSSMNGARFTQSPTQVASSVPQSPTAPPAQMPSPPAHSPPRPAWRRIRSDSGLANAAMRPSGLRVMSHPSSYDIFGNHDEAWFPVPAPDNANTSYEPAQTFDDHRAAAIHARPLPLQPQFPVVSSSRPASWYGTTGESSGDDGTGRYRPAWRSVHLSTAPEPQGHDDYYSDVRPPSTQDAIFPASPGPDRASSSSTMRMPGRRPDGPLHLLDADAAEEADRRARIEAYNSAEWSQATTMIPNSMWTSGNPQDLVESASNGDRLNDHDRLRAALEQILHDTSTSTASGLAVPESNILPATSPATRSRPSTWHETREPPAAQGNDVYDAMMAVLGGRVGLGSDVGHAAPPAARGGHALPDFSSHTARGPGYPAHHAEFSAPGSDQREQRHGHPGWLVEANAASLRSPTRRSHGGSPQGVPESAIYRPPSVVVPPSPNLFINFDEPGATEAPQAAEGWAWIDQQPNNHMSQPWARQTWHPSPHARQHGHAFSPQRFAYEAPTGAGQSRR